MSERLVAGRYRTIERLGHGPMSEVFLAEDVELGRRVALKLLGREADPARFEREARAAAALTHPNVNQLFDYGEVDGRPFMVLEYLAGGTLEGRLRQGRPLPDSETEEIARGVAAGLAHAHERGLVHRDLKPSNVLFDADGRPKIADFGIARMGGAGTLTEAGTVMGTAAYISPEQAAGEGAGPASDVYSLGVILFRMLTGRLPFESKQPVELVRMHRDVPAPRVASIRPDVPPRLAAIVDSALAKDPADRPPDGSAVAAALGASPPAVDETATEILPPPRRPVPPPSAAERRRSRIIARIRALEIRCDGIDLGLGASETHVRPKSRDDPVAPRGARFQILLRKSDWFPNVGATSELRTLHVEQWQRKIELLRHNSDDGKSAAV